MNRFSVRSCMAALTVIACMTGATFAQDASTQARPMFERLKPVLRNDVRTPATPLTTWNGSFVYQKTTYKYNMVGAAPSTGKSTTIPTFIIPVVLKFTSGGKTTTFSPLSKLTNGKTAVTNTTASPIFANMDFKSGGVDMGTTQYEDAFQRGNFWTTVNKGHTGYHVLLGTPTTLPTLTLTVPAADGKVTTDFGITVGNADIFWFDTQLQSYISSHTQIVPNSLPIFITYNSYLTEFGGCCIGGYHSSFGSTSAPQAYAHFTYISTPGIFAQDVSALSHEAGEWLDDPLVVNTSGNTVQCGILEVGDPEEGFSNFGAFPYSLGGFTYNLQDLTYLEYFGAPNTTSVSKEMTFQSNPFSLSVCSNGG